MKKLKKNLTQKMIISIMVVITLSSLLVPNYSQANFGGALLDPICDFLCALADGANWVMNIMAGEDENAYIFGGAAYEYLHDHAAQDMENAKKQNPDLTVSSLKMGTEDEDDIGAGDNPGIPNVRVTPAEIFAGKVAIVDANFFNTESNDDYANEMVGDAKNSAALNLKTVISNWYNAFRLIAIVGLLSVLVYIGIRIVISSTAEQKADYKKSLVDWIVALCLVFCLHYIMVFSMTMVKEIQKMIVGNSTGDRIYSQAILIQNKDCSIYEIKPDGTTTFYELEGNTSGWLSKAWEGVKTGFGSLFNTVFHPIKTLEGQITQLTDGNALMFFPTNLVGYTRTLCNSPNGLKKITYTVMYLALTFYSIYFVFVYMKRLIILTFLTIIAPLVALTYPIDKLKDGKAQAFNYWLREYLVNAMLPLLHLILYTVLVTSAIDLAARIPLYAICVLAFIVPAEKLVKSMFGIKSETAPALGGFAGGAMATHALSALKDKLGGAAKKGASGKENAQPKDKVHYNDNSSFQDLADSYDNGGELGEGQNKPELGSSGDTEQTPEQDMLDSYDDNFGTDAWDAQERDTLANAANQSSGAGNNLSESEYRQLLENDGWDKADIDKEMKDKYPQAKPASSSSSSRTAQPLQKAKRKSKLRNFAGNAANMVRRKYRIPKGMAGVKELAKRGARASLRAGIGISGAAIGLAGGIVGGDLNDTWKGLIGGAVAGTAIGEGVSDRIVDSVSGMGDTAYELANGADAANARRAAKAFASDFDNISYMEKKHPEMSASEIKQKLENMSKYEASGVTDVKSLDKMIDMEEQDYSGSIQTLEEQEFNRIVDENNLGDLSEDSPEIQSARIQAMQNVAESQNAIDARQAAINKTMQIGKMTKIYDNGTFLDDKKYERAEKALTQRLGARMKDKSKAKAAAGDILGTIKKIKGLS